MNETIALLDDPCPTQDQNCVMFRHPDERMTVYVRLLNSPDTFYPCFFAYMGRPVFENMCGFERVRNFHPALNHPVLHDPAQNRGWWSKNLRSVCDALKLDHDGIAPSFPEETVQCGREIVALINHAFERSITEKRAVTDFGPSILFVSQILKFLQSRDKQMLGGARERLNESHETDDPRSWLQASKAWLLEACKSA